jgi:hypothetical protein
MMTINLWSIDKIIIVHHRAQLKITTITRKKGTKTNSKIRKETDSDIAKTIKCEYKVSCFIIISIN